jgi:hypothetical protein
VLETALNHYSEDCAKTAGEEASEESDEHSSGGSSEGSEVEDEQKETAHEQEKNDSNRHLIHAHWMDQRGGRGAWPRGAWCMPGEARWCTPGELESQCVYVYARRDWLAAAYGPTRLSGRGLVRNRKQAETQAVFFLVATA